MKKIIKNEFLLYYLLISLGILLNLLGLSNEVILSDSALHGCVGKEMFLRNNFLELFLYGEDWLDKPHLSFWISAFTYKLIGVSDFAYKFPAILLSFVSVYFTYLFARNNYSKEAGLIASIVLLFSFHFIVSNTDVRMEAFLIAFSTGAIYFFHKFTLNNKFKYLFFGSLFTSLAIMTKGPFLLLIVFSGIFINLLIKKEFKILFSFKWLIAFILIFIFVLPELYSLYYQFDLHPEKKMFDKTNVSGLKFFVWDNQFGRFFNTGPRQGDGNDLFFYFHTILWAFFPWGLAIYISIYNEFKKSTLKIEYVTISTIFFCLFMFSTSQSQLPHYFNIVFPFLSILIGKYLTCNKNVSKFLNFIQHIYFFMPIVIISAFYIYFKPDYDLKFLITLIILIFIYFLIIKFFTLNDREKFILKSTLFGFLFGSFMNFTYYPNMLNYQAGTNAANLLNNNFKGSKVGFFKSWSHPFEFSINERINVFHSFEELNKFIENDSVFLFVYEKIDADSVLTYPKYNSKLIKEFNDFHYTVMNYDFFIYEKRPTLIQKRFLISVKKNE